jgi:hypothetical protein
MRNKNTTKFSILIPVSLFIGFLVFVTWNYLHRGLFEYIGIDYRLWYASGQIARNYGFNQIYDSALQSHYQSQLFTLFSTPSNWSMPFWPLPLPNLSIFILPMLLLTFINPIPGFLLWTIINILGSLVYIWQFLKRIDYSPSNKWLLSVIISLPFLLNILFGQNNLILLIALGESLIQIRKENDLNAGLFLGFMVLKPQTLLLIVPALLISRKYKIFLGTLYTSCGLILLSILLSGKQAILGPYQVITSWPTILADSGVNLLTLSQNISKFSPGYLPIIITALSVFATIYFVVKYFSFQHWKFQSAHIEVDFLILYIATCLISPHANIHMLLPQVILLLAALHYGYLTNRELLLWGALPLSFFLFTSIDSIAIAHNIAGILQILVNIYLLYILSVKNSNTKVVE